MPLQSLDSSVSWLFNGGVVPAGSSAVDLVDGEVRELIRRRGLDPFSDPAPVRMLVRDVVADYSERSLSSALPPIGDPTASSATCWTGSPATGRCNAGWAGCSSPAGAAAS
jgi:hypothetical protein